MTVIGVDRAAASRPVIFWACSGNTMVSELSEKQLEQRADARIAASVARKQRQMRRLHGELRQVHEKLLALGVHVDYFGRPSAGLMKINPAKAVIVDGEASKHAVCSAAGTTLQRCAEGKKGVQTHLAR